jgi:hypothetical protein
VQIFGPGTRNVSHIADVAQAGTTELSDLSSQVLTAIELNATALEIDIRSERENFEKETMVDWLSEGVLLPNNGAPIESTSDLTSLILSAIVALLLHIAVGFVWIKEQKNARVMAATDEPSTAPPMQGAALRQSE